MLFRKKIQKSCSYCSHGTTIDEEHVLCKKKGFVPVNGKCRKFSYDPCKRIPVKQRALDFSKYTEDEFAL